MMPTLMNPTPLNAKRLAGSTMAVLNYCAKHFGRSQFDARHANSLDAQSAQEAFRASILEPWRFPLVEPYRDPADPAGSALRNRVTFVFFRGHDNIPQSVQVIGTFARLTEPVTLERIGDTPYFFASVVVPRGQVFRYLYQVDGQFVQDPVNPQTQTLPNGEVWSQVFTDGCTVPLTLSKWEYRLLTRLTQHVLPFHTADGQNFLNREVLNRDAQTRDAEYPHLYRVDKSVGVVNYIDKVLTREERHHRVDYTLCLQLINQVLRQRDGVNDIERMRRGLFTELYDQMAANDVPGWDYSRYNSPAYFLQLFRRHAYTGAFSHPKYGGNVGGLGWQYLSEVLRDPATGGTLFDWRRNTEFPLGTSADYNG